MKHRGRLAIVASILVVVVACTSETNVSIDAGADGSSDAAPPAVTQDATPSADAAGELDGAIVDASEASTDAANDGAASDASTDADAACTCFETGQWSIANLSPCIATYTPGGGGQTEYAATSTIDKGAGTYGCPNFAGPATKPTTDWSSSTFKVDCAGTFTLRYRIRVGDFAAPNAMTDCVLGEVSLPATAYTTPNVAAAWPNLPAWINEDDVCVKKWSDRSALGNVSPGYGEMIVVGDMGCGVADAGAEFVFNRIKYCPTECNANPGTAACMACAQSGLGVF
jgi:hypothetical protein